MNTKRAIELMTNAGYKITTPRKLVFDVFLNNEDKHLSPEEIHRILSAEKAEIGIATVYRTLLLFEKLRIVQKHNFDDNCSRYELTNEDEHNHHHLICKCCGDVDEVRIDLLDDLESKIEKSHGFKIENHDLKFIGICNKCKEK